MYYGIDNPHGGDVYGKNIRLDFSANVNPYGTPASVIEAAKNALDHTALYPDPYCRDLTKTLAGSLDVPESMLYIGSGASELIYAYCHACQFRKAVVVSPTFLEYSSALKTAGTQTIPYICGKEDGFMPDERLFSFLKTEKPDAVLLCNPNNPTGRTVSYDFMRDLMRETSDIGSYLFVDECFYELSDRKITVKDELKTCSSLFILRAFTKSFALASLRLGYCMCSDPEVLKKMSAVTPPWSVSGEAQAAGIAALKETGFLRETAKKISDERERFSDLLDKAGLRVFPSEVNYLFIEAGEDLQEKLRKEGIEIRSCANYDGLGPGFFRIAVRRPEENDVLIEAVRKLMRV